MMQSCFIVFRVILSVALAISVTGSKSHQKVPPDQQQQVQPDQHLQNHIATHLRGGRITLPRRLQQLDSKYLSCNFEGKTRDPGQWLEGPALTCMCDRKGSGEWTTCVDNGFTPHTKSGSSALDRRQQFDKEDFVFDLLGSVPGSLTPSGSIQSLGVTQLPSLAGEGVSYSLFNIEPCGINLPHVHPRATELIYVIKGIDLQTAFVEENGANSRVIMNTIGVGEATFFPQGLIHYQQNLGCETATYISALNSEDPGVSTIPTQFFRLPISAVEGSLNESESRVQQLVDGLPKGPSEGHVECLRRCGL